MVTVGMNYVTQPGKESEFVEKFAAVNQALSGASGHTSSTLWRDTTNDASFLITSEWSDEQAFRDFITSDAFRAVTSWAKGDILAERPSHKVYKH